MPEYPPERIYDAARALLPSLNEPLRRQVEALLAQAEGGADTHLQLLDLLTREDATCKQLRALLRGEEALLGFGPFGDPVIPPDIYRCQHQPPHYYPEKEIEDRDEWGRPLCPEDGTLMERVGASPPQED